MVRTKKVYRRHILDGAYNLVLEEGFKKFQARNIAKRISCSTQPIYREFDNLAEVRDALEERVKEKYQNFLENSSCGSLRELSQLIVAYAQKNPLEFQRFFIEDPEAGNTLKKLTQDHYQKMVPHSTSSFFNLFWCYIIGRASLSGELTEESHKELDLLAEILSQ